MESHHQNGGLEPLNMPVKEVLVEEDPVSKKISQVIAFSY